jgi:hypothetical protein
MLSNLHMMIGSVKYLFPVPLAVLPSLRFSPQAILNMPSADISTSGKHFFMPEPQWRPQQNGRYWYGASFYTYGLG